MPRNRVIDFVEDRASSISIETSLLSWQTVKWSNSLALNGLAVEMDVKVLAKIMTIIISILS